MFLISVHSVFFALCYIFFFSMFVYLLFCLIPHRTYFHRKPSRDNLPQSSNTKHHSNLGSYEQHSLVFCPFPSIFVFPVLPHVVCISQGDVFTLIKVIKTWLIGAEIRRGNLPVFLLFILFLNTSKSLQEWLKKICKKYCKIYKIKKNSCTK